VGSSSHSGKVRAGRLRLTLERRPFRRARYKWRALYEQSAALQIIVEILGAVYTRARRLGGKEIRVALTVYGLIVVVVACGHIAAHRPAPESNLQRQQDLSTGVDVVRHGGLPLVGVEGASGSVRYYPLAYNDDRGAYIYLSAVGSLARSSTATSLMKWSFLVLFAPIFAFYPLVFFEITGSIVIGLVAPWMIWWKFAWFEDKGVYWIPGWCVLLCLPLVLLVYRRWNRWSLPLLALLVTVGSFASSIRANAGLPVLFAAVAVTLLKVRPWSQRLLFVAVFIIASMSISSAVMSGVQHRRDALLRTDLSRNYPTGHPTWHSTYIGLGYLRNKYHIRWDDSSAFDYVKQVRPDAPPYSKAYESVLRHRVLRIAFHNPGFVVRTYFVKAGVVVRQMFRRYWLIIPAVLVLFVFAPPRSDVPGVLLITLLAAIGAAVPTVVAVPDVSFELGLLAACTVAALVSIGSLVALVERRVQMQLATLGHLPRRAGAAGLGIGAVLAALSLYPGVSGAEALNYYRTYQSELVGKTTGVRLVRVWRLGYGARGWTANPRMNAFRRRGRNELIVRTDPTPYSYNLSSPVHVLPPGQYETRVAGRVKSGGLMLGVLDVTRGQWIGTSAYWWGQSVYAKSEMAVRLTLTNPTHVQVVLANFALHPTRSVWQIKEVREVRQYLTSCAINPVGAWYPNVPIGSGELTHG
jgi:hypothetical protein